VERKGWDIAIDRKGKMYEFVRAFQKGKSAKSIKEIFLFQNFPSLIRQPTEKGCVFLEPIINRLEVAMKIIL
jgi:hypothetical protein